MGTKAALLCMVMTWYDNYYMHLFALSTVETSHSIIPFVLLFLTKIDFQSINTLFAIL